MSNTQHRNENSHDENEIVNSHTHTHKEISTNNATGNVRSTQKKVRSESTVESCSSVGMRQFDYILNSQPVITLTRYNDIEKAFNTQFIEGKNFLIILLAFKLKYNYYSEQEQSAERHKAFEEELNKVGYTFEKVPPNEMSLFTCLSIILNGHRNRDRNIQDQIIQHMANEETTNENTLKTIAKLNSTSVESSNHTAQVKRFFCLFLP